MENTFHVFGSWADPSSLPHSFDPLASFMIAGAIGVPAHTAPSLSWRGMSY